MATKQNSTSLLTCLERFKSSASAENIEVDIGLKDFETHQLQIDKSIANALDKLLAKILDFTPETCKISIRVSTIKNEEIVVYIYIEGINLYRISEILLTSQLKISRFNSEDKSSSYKVFVPRTMHYSKVKPLNFSPYYVELNRNLRNHFLTINGEKAHPKVNQEHDLFLRKINTVLQLHLKDGRSGVAHLAKSLHMSRIHLYRKIKAITGKSPLAYIMLFKLELAKQLLKDKQQNLSVTEVAYSCGFSDKAHFSRSFKKQFGLTPSGFKKQAYVT